MDSNFKQALAELQAKYPNLPVADHRRDGCKVGWLYFNKAREDEARYRAAYEREFGDLMAAYGYDFGYQCPGQVTFTKEEKWCVTTA